MAQDLHDEWDNEGGGGGPAVISWKGVDPGEPGSKFTGIIVPPNPLTEPTKGYQPVIDRNSDGPRVWPPKSGYVAPEGVNPEAPISERAYLNITGGDESQMRHVSITELTLVTDYSNKEFFSGPRKKAAREDENFRDDSLRRVLVDGADLPPKFRDAVKALKTKGPQPGQRLTIELVDRVANKGKEGEKKILKVTLEAPTPETLKVVERYVAESKKGAENAGAEDQWAASKTEDAPPF